LTPCHASSFSHLSKPFLVFASQLEALKVQGQPVVVAAKALRVGKRHDDSPCSWLLATDRDGRPHSSVETSLVGAMGGDR
jgi:hypothetical protein